MKPGDAVPEPAPAKALAPVTSRRYRPGQRLRARREFQRPRHEGLTFHQPTYVLRVLPEDGESAPPAVRFAVITSRKVGRAHQRNRARRLLREAFRHEQAHTPGGHYLIAIAKRACVTAELAALREAFHHDLKRAQQRLAARASSDATG